MIRQYKLIFEFILHTSLKKPNITKLITFCSNVVQTVNERPIAQFSNNSNDCTVITPASLLTPSFDKYTPIGVAHDKNHFRRDYRFNLALECNVFAELIEQPRSLMTNLALMFLENRIKIYFDKIIQS